MLLKYNHISDKIKLFMSQKHPIINQNSLRNYTYNSKQK